MDWRGWRGGRGERGERGQRSDGGSLENYDAGEEACIADGDPTSFGFLSFVGPQAMMIPLLSAFFHFSL